MIRRRPFAQMVDDYQTMPGGDLDREIKWLAEMVPTLQRMKAAALNARRRQRRKVAR